MFNDDFMPAAMFAVTFTALVGLALPSDHPDIPHQETAPIQRDVTGFVTIPASGSYDGFYR